MITSFHPTERTLMGPGPSDVSPRVLEALSRPTIGHLDPEFIGLMDEIKTLLHYAFKTNNELTIPVSAPGPAGMEACFVNLVSPGDKVIVCQNGVFGGRMKENVERCGGVAIMVEDSWGSPVDADKVKAAFSNNTDIKILAFVHAETSTGVESDAAALCRLAAENNALSIVDTVTSVAGSNRQHKVQSWFLDMQLVMGYWGANTKRAYHHTAPVNAMYALHESLIMLKEEGLENSWARHQLNHRALVSGLEAMGLSMVVDAAHRLPQLNLVSIPEGADDAAVRSALLSQYSLEIGAGLGALSGNSWRIGLMGHASNQKNVLLCLSALDNVLTAQGAKIVSGVAVAAALAEYG